MEEPTGARPRAGGLYQGYFLLNNPFPGGAALLTLHNLRSFKEANRVFAREARQAELMSLHTFIAESLEGNGPRHLWITGAKGAGKTAVLVQAVCEAEEVHHGRALPVYVNMPPVGEEITRGVFSAVLERIDGEQLRECSAALLALELESGVDANFRGVNTIGLLEEIRQNGGAVLERILFGDVTPFQMERQRLRHILLSAARRRNLGEQAEKALDVSVTKGFQEGALSVKHGKGQSADVISLMKLLGLRFKRIILFIDQLDTVWPRMNLRERELFFCALSELVRLAGSLLSTALVADPAIKSELRDPYLEEALRVLPPAERHVLEIPEFHDPIHVAKILLAYLDADPGRQEAADELEARGFDPLFPFHDHSVEALTRRAGGNISRILVAASDLIELGRKNGFPEISPDHLNEIF